MSHAMWGAAPHQTNRLRLLLAAVVAAAVASTAAAADPRPNASVLPELWGVAANGSFRSATFVRLHRAGINTVVLDSRRLRPRQIQRLRRAAGGARLRVVQPALLPRPGSVADAQKACNALRSAHPGSACALWASTVACCGDPRAVRRRRPRGRAPLRSRGAACPRGFLRQPDTGDRPARKALPRALVAEGHPGGELQRHARPRLCAAQGEAEDRLGLPEATAQIGRDLP